MGTCQFKVPCESWTGDYSSLTRLEMHGNIESLMKDVHFLNAISRGNTFWVDNKQVTEYKDVNLPSSLQKKYGNDNRFL